MNWLHYLVEANLYLAVFYAIYYLFLSNDTHYVLNRAYLLVTSVIAFIIPLMQLGLLKPVEPQLVLIESVPPPQSPSLIPAYTPPAATISFTWQDGLIAVYLLGVVILFVVFFIKTYQLFKLTRAARAEVDPAYKLIYVDDSNTAFSFFNFLFIGTKASGTDTIIQHELVHIRQKHSIDIIFVEFLKIVNWFNPVIYLLQASLKTLHEYIADEQTATHTNDVIGYSTFLVNNAYGLSGSSITHSFFNYNLLKKRIIMLNQQRSGKLARLKYLVAIPVCTGMLCASTLAFSKDYGFINVGPHRINKNNKTPQVADALDHLLITQNGISYITDKFTHKNVDGSVRYFTPRNISNKNIVDLKKEGIIVNFVSGDIGTTVKNDTSKHNVHVKQTFTSKGYRYEEDGYVNHGKTDFRVIIVEKNGEQKSYFKNTTSAVDLKLLSEKYGYSFPVMEIYTKLPPPPPVAAPSPGPSSKRLPPPPPIPPVKKQDKIPPPPPVPVKTTKVLVPQSTIFGFFTKSIKNC